MVKPYNSPFRPSDPIFRLLDDLDEDLFPELDEMCRGNQLAYQPISRGRNADTYLVERYPELLPLVGQDRQRRIDSMRLKFHLHEDEMRVEKPRVGYTDKTAPLESMGQKRNIGSQ